MGRFYQPAQAPQFVEGMYTPPWELINKRLEQEQTGYENSLITTNMFKDLDVKHIKDPVLDARAEDIKNYYTEKTQKIEDAIKKDPSSWKKLMPDIQNLGRELAKDMKSGELKNMSEQYDSLKNMVEAHQEYKELYPEDYTKGMNQFYSDFQSDPLRRKTFDWHQLAKPIDNEKFFKDLANIKPSTEVELKNGRLISIESVSQAQIDRVATSKLFSSPEYSAYIGQKVSFKDPSYFNQRYKELNGGNGFYQKIYRDPNATNKSNDMDMLSNEEVKKKMERYKEDHAIWSNLSDKEKLKKTEPSPNEYVTTENGAIGQLIESAKARGYYSKEDIKGDPITAAMISANASSTNQALNREVSREGQTLRGLTAIATSSQSQIESIELLVENTKIDIEDLDTDYSALLAAADKGEIKKIRNTAGKVVSEIAYDEDGKVIKGYTEYLAKKKTLQENLEKQQKQRVEAGIITATAAYKLRKFTDPATKPTTSELKALAAAGETQ